MAQPGETIHCKLSVMANALFHLRPLPPYHHVPDVDKQSTRVNTSELDNPMKKKRGYKPPVTRPAPPPTLEVTPTRFLDFFTWAATRAHLPKFATNPAYDRPPLLGIEFIPREKTLVKPEQRDMWDFVLRKCFVRETSTIGEAVPKLAFGAENLVPRFAEGEGSKYAGAPVTPDTMVRFLTVEQWARVVDVFDKWAFKPDNLHVEVPTLVEESREIGLSL